jgi:hypothetical protein
MTKTHKRKVFKEHDSNDNDRLCGGTTGVMARSSSGTLDAALVEAGKWGVAGRSREQQLEEGEGLPPLRTFGPYLPARNNQAQKVWQTPPPPF